ncbi:uroporphyrinogen-III synthase [Streptomyces sp. CB01881]|uniref:uroporphyrinogen-III synthase n=1 Tax=Streptomyces sp. CB01881 TaxID=2078691 RepID=UPI000CDC56A1|nr:uroporphyrinogen-III synthase [Streptomyces sp. CB01881]AUY48578.1 uroporphyrinogen-III synthase [Streptomyces sp. CB01881]TYC77068.1 uroporphyrinogen-III synthase [Streptomyces sp. CB01881]
MAPSPTGPRPSGQPGPLTGFTIGVTAARRRDELVALLTRRGAQVVEAPVLRITPLADDLALRQATERCLAAPLDYVVATTGVGWRGWMSAAEGWGRGTALADACRDAVVLSRGPKATGAVRASGLGEGFSPDTEATDELLTWLLARPLAGRRIAVQEHGIRLDAFAAALRERGAEVISVPVYRWEPPDDPAPVRRLVEQTVRRQVHALTFTSAPAVTAFVQTATAEGLREPLLEALRGDVLPVCVGVLCARPFAELGLPAVFPERGRLGSLVRLLAETLPGRGRQDVTVAGRTLTLQGNAVMVDGRSHWLSPRGAAVLRALAERPGRVLSRAELLRTAWADATADEHAVEAAVGRLRAALGPHGGLIRTVPKRGYRLAAG